MRKIARDNAFIQKVSKETGIPEDKLWRKSPAGGGGGQPGGPGAPRTIPEGAMGIVMPGPDGQPQIVPLDQIPGMDAAQGPIDPLTNTEPELAPPKHQTGWVPADMTDTSVDTLPKQNPGLSRNREQPYQR